MATKTAPKRSRPVWTRSELDRVCEKEAAAVARFLDELGPLLRYELGKPCPWQIRDRGEEAVRDWVDDRLQDLLAYKLLAHDARVLRRWDPARAPVDTYLRFVAANFVRDHLRGEIPELAQTDLLAEPGDLDRRLAASLEDELVCARVVDRLRALLGEAKFQGFLRAFRLDDNQKKQAPTGSQAARDKERERLRELVREVLREVAPELPVPPRRPRPPQEEPVDPAAAAVIR